MAGRDAFRRAAPRSWISLFWAIGGWVPLIGLVVAALFAAFSIESYRLAARMEAGALETVAQVVSHRRAGGRSTTYHVTFAFTTATGVAVEAEHKVRKGYYREVRDGEQRRIRYLPDTPSAIEAEFGENRREARMMAAVAGGLVLAAGAGLIHIRRRIDGGLRARRDGARRRARVTGVGRSSANSLIARRGWLAWEEPDGQTGRSLNYRYKQLEAAFGPGDEIEVYRLGKHGWWVDDLGPPEDAGPIR